MEIEKTPEGSLTRWLHPLSMVYPHIKVIPPYLLAVDPRSATKGPGTQKRFSLRLAVMCVHHLGIIRNVLRSLEKSLEFEEGRYNLVDVLSNSRYS